MPSRKSIVPVAAAITLCGAVSRATVTPVIVQIPISAGALTDDPNLSNYCCFDLQGVITGTPNDRIGGTDLRAILTTGTFYIPPSVPPFAADSDKPQSNFWAFASLRYYQFDTFVTAPRFDSNRTTILGPATYPPPTLGTTATFPRTSNSKNTVDVAFGDTTANSDNYPDGSYTVARLTIAKGSGGFIRGRMGSLQNAQGIVFSFSVDFGDPEPTTAALTSIAMGALALRRRR